MSGNTQVDQCPFCNAFWGECSHVRLLLELEHEADMRSADKRQERESAETSLSPPAKVQPAR
ncbi:hypothetical protein PZ897_15165 [Hoeflea sp. YIM 152468]|uniref:hypothetical protein n=1 Tax=Hoeflea sp. YIM 152468 TaxID=3031759 RepID=UPI0023DB7185|nr:hypothetical protein [Hoeflea sp. YIM 152468]MDF1609525.1 hypothetical protein [Hoeflea sp. YIM 152468]